jgi:16S rRNA C967 or C1407 C5-methylase (RsmB/RsmF family)
MANYTQTSVHFNGRAAERGRNDPWRGQAIADQVMQDDRMRGYDRNMEEYMKRFAYHLEDALRRQESENASKFEMINAKYERDVSELKNEVENLTERLDSVDYYAEEDVPKAA